MRGFGQEVSLIPKLMRALSLERVFKPLLSLREMIPRLIVRNKVMIFSDDQQRDFYSLVKLRITLLKF